MSYLIESNKLRSEKIILITCESVQRLKLFNVDGSNYSRTVSHFISKVKVGSTLLTQLTSTALSLNSFYFDAKNMKLYVKVGGDPKGYDLSVTYKHFLSSAPIILPNDLLNGEDVEWLPLVQSIGSIGQQLDEESTGTILESSSSVKLINRDGYFDNIFDRLIWENQEIKFYSWFPNLPISEKVQTFEGVIESKDFSEDSITFKVKDFVYRLRNKLDLGLYSELDGSILPSLIGKNKRRIYGQVDNVKTVSLDATLGGYQLTGTLSGTTAALIITGSGTLFLDEVSPTDELFITVSNIVYKFGIESIDSDTQITLSKELEISFSGISGTLKPKLPWRKKNREWLIAGHKLRSPSATITTINNASSFSVGSILDFFDGDEVEINGVPSSIRRISGDNFIMATNIIPLPAVGDFITKRPIKKVFLGSDELVYLRDYTFTNTTESKIMLDELAEFNIAEPHSSNILFTFSHLSNTVTTTYNTDVKTIIQPRDWIRSADITEPEWYEVLDIVQDTSTRQLITLRTPFTGTNGNKDILYKNPKVVDENSLVTVSCLGMESGGKWIKSASDAVRHLMLNDAGFSTVNETSFTKAKATCDYILSMVIPESIEGESPMIREVVNKINDSVFGSLYGNNSQSISYSILNSTKPEITTIIRDDDIISFSINCNQTIINKAKINYSPYVDVYSGESALKSITYTSTFVDKYIGIENTKEKTIYLYEDSKALIVAQRICFYNSLSRSIVNLKTKMNFSTTGINDKIYLSLDRLYTRYTGTQRERISIVTGVKNDGYGCEITLTDLGNIYNRIPSIAPTSSSVYTSATSEDKIRWGYILSNSTETPNENDESAIGSGLIG